MTEFHASLSGTLPAGWYARESITFVSPDGAANVIASIEPVDVGVDSESYASVQGELLRRELTHYHEISFGAAVLFGGRRGYVRQFEWSEADGRRFNQIQAYHVVADRGCAVTATTTAADVGRFAVVLHNVLFSMRIAVETTTPDAAIPWQQVRSSELFTFFSCTEVQRRRESDGLTWVTLRPGGFQEFVRLRIGIDDDDDARAFVIELDRRWLDGPERLFGADLAKSVVAVLCAKDRGLESFSAALWDSAAGRAHETADRTYPPLLRVFEGRDFGPASSNGETSLVASNIQRDGNTWFVLSWHA